MKHPEWKKRALLAAISGALLLGASGQALAVDKALIVGVGKFQLSRANLPGIDLDVNMAKDIAAYMGIRQENIHVVMDEQATYSRVRDEMKSWLGQGVSSDDRVFIYFSSHGALVEDKDGDEPDGNSEALVLHDIDGKSNQGIYDDDEVGADLKQIPSRNVVIMVDSCHSGTMTKSLDFGGNSFNVRNGKPKFLNLFNRAPKKFDRGMVAPKCKPQPGGECKDFELEGNEENYVAFSAAQDSQQSVATEKGSLFTLAFLDSFVAAREKSDPPTLKGIYQMTENKLKESMASFQPNMTGNKTIAERPLRVASNGGEGGARNGPLWQDISGLVGQMPRLEIGAPATRAEGEATEFVVDVPSDGYLNIVMIGPRDNGTVLFPNSYHADNRVSVGKLNFPTKQMPFKIKARAPYGKTLVAAFVTKEKVNLMEEGFGNRDSSGKSISAFAHITRGGMKALAKGTRDLEPSPDPKFWGGKAEIEIKGK